MVFRKFLIYFLVIPFVGYLFWSYYSKEVISYIWNDLLNFNEVESFNEDITKDSYESKADVKKDIIKNINEDTNNNVIGLTSNQNNKVDNIKSYTDNNETNSKIINKGNTAINENNKSGYDNYSKPANNNNNIKMEGNFIERLLSKIFINAIKTSEGREFINRLFLDRKYLSQTPNNYIKFNDTGLLHKIFSTKDYGDIEGLPAICGSLVNISVKLTSSNGLVIDEFNKSLVIGSSEILPIIETMVIGMHENQKRVIKIPPKFFNLGVSYYGNKFNSNESYEALIHLNKISSKLKFNQDEIKVYDSHVNMSMPNICRFDVNFEARIKDISGDVIFDSKNTGNKVSLKENYMNYPAIFLYSIFNKPFIGMRTIICRGYLLNSYSGEISRNIVLDNIKINKEGYYIVEISDLY